MRFDWDEAKREANLRKHTIDFVAAARVLLGNPCVRQSKNPGSDDRRFIAIGKLEGRLYTIIYTVRDDVYRIISARRASDEEREEWAIYRAGHPADEG